MAEKIEIPITGMNCAACAARIERELNKLGGVKEARVNFPLKKAEVLLGDNTDLKNIISVIREIGYDVDIERDITLRAKREEKELLRDFIITACLTVPIMIFSMWPILPYNNWILLILTIPVEFYFGLRFHRPAISNLKHLNADMNTLISLGTISAFFYSLLVVLFPQKIASIGIKPHVYFDSCSMIIAIVLLGRFFESKAKTRTYSAIKLLYELSPNECTVVKEGKEIRIDTGSLEVGDIVIIRPGEKVPADGVVIEGSSYVDESMITGEGLPSSKTTGDEVIAGTLNGKGSLLIRVTRIGKDTVLSKIIRLVEEAQFTKAPVQRLADRVASIFVPVVILISIITCVFWLVYGDEPKITNSLLSSVSVLIIACPCALGLAIPTAIMVSTGIAAKLGILIKNAASVELSSKAKYILFDKTGTLTKGQIELSEIKPFLQFTERDVLKIAYSLERLSEHPFADALRKKAEETDIETLNVKTFQAVPGKGVKGIIEGNTYYLGNMSFYEEINGRLEDDVKKHYIELSQMGGSPVLLWYEDVVMGILNFKDKIREESQYVVSALKASGIEPVMITGDIMETAKAISDNVSIDRYYYRVLPDQKANIVEDYKKKGITLMVGDGINDAPSLVTAHVGIAMGKGTDIAIESADVVLMKGQLSKLLTFLKLSRKTLKIIKQNLFWAFIYNIIGIPVAAGVLYPHFGIRLEPMFGAIAMTISSVSVVTNSLRLKMFKE
ncbi:MAG TPA: heavy metal translocating P-type ATPase [Syntrophorhabdaceae bacterium]|nr:heavy metal translocating P-type ATPase [Syntrophorhabdaceae bacterium]